MTPDNAWLATLGLDTAPQISNTASPDSIGPMFFTPSQADFREYLSRGYDGNRIYAAEPSKAQDSPTSTAPANANVGMVERNPDGSMDFTRQIGRAHV